MIKSWLVLLAAGALAAASPVPTGLSIHPENPLLFGKGARQRLVVVAHYPDGKQREVTGETKFRSRKPSVATVSEAGLIRVQADGGAHIEATWGGLAATTTALIQRAEKPTPPSFAGDVLPILTKAGCNGSNCHGALNGQNGFKLSLFGYGPDEDYEMIVHQHDGRRVNLTEPKKSLLLVRYGRQRLAQL